MRGLDARSRADKGSRSARRARGRGSGAGAKGAIARATEENPGRSPPWRGGAPRRRVPTWCAEESAVAELGGRCLGAPSIPGSARSPSSEGCTPAPRCPRVTHCMTPRRAAALEWRSGRCGSGGARVRRAWRALSAAAKADARARGCGAGVPSRSADCSIRGCDWVDQMNGCDGPARSSGPPRSERRARGSMGYAVRGPRFAIVTEKTQTRPRPACRARSGRAPPPR